MAEPSQGATAPTCRAPAGARLGAGYRVPVASVPGRELVRLRRELTLARRPTGFGSVALDPVQCAIQTGEYLDVPRFFGVERWGAPESCDLSDGCAMSPIGFDGELRDDDARPQRRALDACLGAFRHPGLAGGMLVLPCGYGKTVVAIAVALAHGRRTLVVVGKQFLMSQWAAAIARFAPSARIGYLWRDRVEVEGADIVLGMLHSMVQRTYPADALRSFGLAIFDEAHHVAAESFNRAVRVLPARCVLGLSATPDRCDGLGPLLAWSLGPVLFRAVRPPEPVLVMVLHYTAGAERMRTGPDGRPLTARMTTDLVTDAVRNAAIALEITALYAARRHILVLSERVAQLGKLRLLLAPSIPSEDIGEYVGDTKPAARQRAETCDVILSTYAMAREGLDIKRLDTLVLASPVTAMEQAVGRIQRPGEDKQVPLVVDVLDLYGPFATRARRRAAYFKANGFVVHKQATDGAAHRRPAAAAWARTN
jgi:superfamily II DNA or RNA helicase